MILECKSCSKKFLVPDTAITSNGRLVQCSSCGNKWTQYPIMKETPKNSNEIKSKIDILKKTKTISKPKKNLKKKAGPSIYSREYLQQKHGLKIGGNKTNNKNKKSEKTNLSSSSFGFYSYLIIIIFFIITFFGILNLTKEIIVFNFPFLDKYIGYLFENISYFGIIIKDLFNIY